MSTNDAPHDPIDRAAEVLSRVEKTTGPSWLDRERAQALDDAGLLVDPRGDEWIALQALRRAADGLPGGMSSNGCRDWLHERADQIEKRETDA